MKYLIRSLAFVVLLASCKTSKFPDLEDGIYADIQTNKGDMLVQLEYEKTPLTVANFVSLAEGNSEFVSEEFKGKSYYDGLIFHRVMKGFMIQGGDPLGNGTGNPGYRFADEFNDSLKHDKKGVISMANGGPNTNGSQFFITHGTPTHLDGVHSVFGEVIQGLDIIDSIADVPVAAGNKPVDSVIMDHIEIIRQGKAAKKFDALQIMKDYFAEEEARVAEMKKKKEAFLAEAAAQKEKAELTETGLMWLMLKEGDGPKPKEGDFVMVHYAGWLADGTLIDTSDKAIAEQDENFGRIFQMHRGQFGPTQMLNSPDAPLIPGFREGLALMKEGDKVRFFIPGYLGFGDRPRGPIPANADLIFDIEILPSEQQ